MVRKIVLMVGLAVAALAAVPSRAQDPIAEQFYGSGVHRYFAGDLRGAHEHFTAAIQAGTDDPRPYYYRALAYLRTGRPNEAAADLRRGADLEAADINASYQVSKALERVQGRPRLDLERYRVQARVIAQQRQEQQRRERYAAARRMELEQIQRASAAEPERAPRAAEPPDAIDPFDEAAAPAPLPRAPVDPFDAPPAAAAETDEDVSPFGAPPPAPRPAPRPADPFGPDVKVEEDIPAELPDDLSDPFGIPAAPAPAREAAEPFGDSATPAEAADTADPFGAADSPPQPADAADPFGAAPPANASTARAVQNSTAPQGRAGGLFRALGRAVGLDAARNVAESAAGALPFGRSRPPGMMPGEMQEDAFQFGGPPGAGALPPGMTEDDEIDPFSDPSAGPANDPFGPPPGAAPGQAADPFGVPQAGGDNPFQDDPVQPPAPATNPFDAAR